jgi:hypothetical protein
VGGDDGIEDVQPIEYSGESNSEMFLLCDPFIGSTRIRAKMPQLGWHETSPLLSHRRSTCHIGPLRLTRPRRHLTVVHMKQKLGQQTVDTRTLGVSDHRHSDTRTVNVCPTRSNA